MKTKCINSCDKNDLAAKKYVKRNRITVDNMMRLMKDYGQDGIDHLLEGLFLRGAEYSDRAMIKKASDWLEENLARETSIIASGTANINFENVIRQFKQAMKI